MTGAADPAPPARAAARLEPRIDLYPHEWSYASWRPVADPPGPPPPFDPTPGLRALRAATAPPGYGLFWTAPPFDGPLSDEEAAAWLWAGHRVRERGETLKRFVDLDALRHVREHDPFVVADRTRLPRGLAMNCLVSVEAPAAIAARLVGDAPVLWHRDDRHELIAGVRAFLLPRLTPAERDGFAAAVRARLATVRWRAHPDEPPDTAFALAAQLGLHDELQALVDSWPDDQHRGGPGWHREYWQSLYAVVLGLGSPEAVRAAFSRFGLRLERDWHLAGFLAHTGVTALDLAVDEATGSHALATVLPRVHAAEAVVPVLELLRGRSRSGIARDWLAAHPVEALVGAAPLLGGTHPFREQAVELVRARLRAGDDVARALPFLDAADAARLTALAAEHEVLPELRPDELPPEIAHDLADPLPTGARRNLPRWIDVPALPPVVVDGRGRLAADAVRTVLLTATALKPGEAAAPLLATVRAHADPDDLATALVDAWLVEDMPGSGRWAFLAAGALGGDRTAAHLARLIRSWPGEGLLRRVELGLEQLVGIGTDTALVLLGDIARTAGYKRLRLRAQAAMERIAEAEGLTRDELEDRVVADGGLDERGTRIFDFGPRQFSFVLAPGLRPMVRDGSGRVRTALPKPNAKDDPALAAAAAAEWKLLRKVVGDLVKVQSVRLEQAMVAGRRWTPTDFDRFLVRHALQRHLARLLVWGAWSPDGSLVGTFRVTDELDLADVVDEPFEPGPDHAVGVVHPLHLSTGARAAWGELLADYEIVPPFPQLGRPVHDVEDDERTATDLTRFARPRIPAAALHRMLDARGWQRPPWPESGAPCLHAKPFPGPGLTAVVEHGGPTPNRGQGADDQSIEHCFVLPRAVGSAQELDGSSRDGPLVPWGAVDPAVRSEVLADLRAVGAGVREPAP